MMSIPRTVSSNISICKRMKVCGEHPFTFPPRLVALKRCLLFSCSLRKETCACTASPFSLQSRVKLDGQEEGGCCRHTPGLLLSWSSEWPPCPGLSFFNGTRNTWCWWPLDMWGLQNGFFASVNTSWRQMTVHLLYLYSCKCPLFSSWNVTY